MRLAADAQPIIPADCLRQPLNSNVRPIEDQRAVRLIISLTVATLKL